MIPPELPAAVRALYPFRSNYKRVNGRWMHYLDEGAGEPIVLLHGNPTWSLLYRNFIPPLAERYRVVAPDYVGFGLSEKPADESAYSLRNHTAILTSLLDGLGLRNVTLVMQDWGGPIGLGYALARRSNVRTLVIMNTWAFTDASRFHRSVYPWRLLHAPIFGQLLLKRRNLMVEANLAMGVFHSERISGAVLETYRFPFPDYDSRTGILAFPRSIPLQPGDAAYEVMARISRGLGDLDVPAKIIWGEQDIVFPVELAYRFQAALPQADEPYVIHEARHFLQEDAPEEITEQIMAFPASIS
ncbi:MAG: alpha/beta fold hydrolase [Dehalococcoidia bacterium]|nr:alpha/beta fold hydrolase [Dehalococcoidia bacterium]